MRAAAESPRARRRLALPTAVCSLRVGPALYQSSPNVTQTNRPASVWHSPRVHPPGRRYPSIRVRSQSKQRSIRLTGERGPAQLPGQPRCASRNRATVGSAGPWHERTFYDGPSPENPSQSRSALLAYTAPKRQCHGASLL